jgi:putative DNA primase/helicase
MRAINPATVAQYASDFGFDVDRLKRGHVADAKNPYNGEPCIALQYLDLEGKLTRTKYRTPDGTVWDDKRQVPVCLYGLWLLPRITADRPIILVEGESDVHACWHHGVMALGLPGCSTWKSAWAKHLVGRQVFVWKEPDQGGTTMAEKVAVDLPDAKVIQPEALWQ